MGRTQVCGGSIRLYSLHFIFLEYNIIFSQMISNKTRQQLKCDTAVGR